MIEDLPKGTHTLVISYLGVRRAIGAVGLALPILLGPVGWLVFGVEIQGNMSSYYHTRLRDVFVGAWCTIGVFLFYYRGYDWIESWIANFGCLSALGLASSRAMPTATRCIRGPSSASCTQLAAAHSS